MKTTTDNGLVQLSNQLGQLGEMECLKILKTIANQPMLTREIAGAVSLDVRDTTELLKDLEVVGLVAKWSKDSWQLTPRGGELWSAIRPLLRE